MTIINMHGDLVKFALLWFLRYTSGQTLTHAYHNVHDHCCFCVQGVSSLYAKLVEVQQQVLHLTKLVQKALPGAAASGDLGSYTLPAGVTLPLITVRAAGDVEWQLVNAATYAQLVRTY